MDANNCETDQKIDPLSPDLQYVVDLAQLLPDPPSRQVLWRWSAKGVRGVRLRTVRIGRRNYTTPDEFRAFLLATQETELTDRASNISQPQSNEYRSQI